MEEKADNRHHRHKDEANMTMLFERGCNTFGHLIPPSNRCKDRKIIT